MTAIINGKRIDGTQYITELTSPGLGGTKDSVDYRVSEIETHLHSAGRWFGAAAVPSGETHIADRVGAGISAFRLDAGNEDWGAWVQVLGSDDTPAETSMVYFDPHEIQISNAQEETTYFIQFGRGESGAAALAAGSYTELVIGIDATKKFKAITPIQTGRAPAGSKIWARCLAIGSNTGTIDFYIGIHEYEG